MPTSTEMLHASTVAIGGRAVLIEGLSGAGKSDLALRLIDRGAMLVSDDYTMLRKDGEQLVASAAPNIAGKIEVRGVGVVAMPHIDNVPVALIVTLGDLQPDRIPEDDRRRMVSGVAVPSIALRAFEASTPIKVELALK